MDRRAFIGALASGLLAAPLAAEAQPAGRGWRIGFLGVSSAADYAAYLQAFRQGLRDLGYEEAKNISLEYRWAEGRNDRLPVLAAGLARRLLDGQLGRLGPLQNPVDIFGSETPSFQIIQ